MSNDDKSAVEVVAGCAGVIFIIFAIIPATIFEGWVLTKLWAWFIVPIFHLPILTITPAIGLALIVGYLAKPYIPSSKNPDKEWYELFFESLTIMFMKPTFALLIGWTVQHWM